MTGWGLPLLRFENTPRTAQSGLGQLEVVLVGEINGKTSFPTAKMRHSWEKRPPPDKRRFAAVLSVHTLLSPWEGTCSKMPGINTGKNASRVTLLIDIT